MTIRASEQGRWKLISPIGRMAINSREKAGATDSSPGHIIEYAESELKCWMRMPSANRTSMPSPWEGDDDEQLDGSGIKASPTIVPAIECRDAFPRRAIAEICFEA
ncbi:hypothetical protein GGI64_005357 [Rhizobium leguminosarum]|uniref:Uncharacterized protein n=1 Tax=Rhizobium leguminosarum TaxID=384 RepID=A0A7Z0E3B0_RHILE|nr:hypothetical protein [Rhizobium leguminosarum]